MKALATLFVLALAGSCFASDPSSPVRAKKAIVDQQLQILIKRALGNFNGLEIGLQVEGPEPTTKEKIQQTIRQLNRSPLTRFALLSLAPSIGFAREHNWFVPDDPNLSDPNLRMSNCLNESEDLRQIRLELYRRSR